MVVEQRELICIGRNTLFAFLSFSTSQTDIVFAKPVDALERSLGCKVL